MMEMWKQTANTAAARERFSGSVMADTAGMVVAIAATVGREGVWVDGYEESSRVVHHDMFLASIDPTPANVAISGNCALLLRQGGLHTRARTKILAMGAAGTRGQKRTPGEQPAARRRVSVSGMKIAMVGSQLHTNKFIRRVLNARGRRRSGANNGG